MARNEQTNTYPRDDSDCGGTWGSNYQSMSKNVVANFSVENFGEITIFGESRNDIWTL